ncbi:MAG: phosphoglyceromutase [Frankiales bacterium]|nr:phosphoglyceromutase [Frankiales bacterium]
MTKRDQSAPTGRAEPPYARILGMATLILLRHGESDWNKKNLFTGWVDVDLTELGEQQAKLGGLALREADLLPTVLHTSLLTRAIRTSNIALEACGRNWIPVKRHWRLNERHYGALQGLDKTATRRQYGDEQFLLWRRSYDVPPPPIEPGSEWDVSSDVRYRSLARDLVPRTECLGDVVRRMLPYWYDAIVPDLRAGETVMVAAHGNSLRGLVAHLDGLTKEQVVGLNIPTGQPLRYELDEDLQPVVPGGEYLDPEAAAKAAAAVAHQGQ